MRSSSTSAYSPELGPIGLSSFPINATRARRYTLLQLRRSPKMHQWIASKNKSRNPTFVKKMRKSHRKQWIIF